MPRASFRKGNATSRKLAAIGVDLPEFRETIGDAASSIRGIAASDPTEATIEGHFENVVYASLQDVGFDFVPEKEASVGRRRHIGRGRTDSRFGAVVIEYKRPSTFRTAKQRGTAAEQLQDYIETISADGHSRVRGYVTDGLRVCELEAVDGEVESRSGFHELDQGALLRIVKALVALDLTALRTENLIRDLCGLTRDGVLIQLARVLDSTLANRPTPKTTMLQSEWEQLFRLAHDDQSQQRRIQDRREALADLFARGITDPADEYRSLFALHTAYAIVLKFLAWRVTTGLYFGAPTQDWKSLVGGQPSALRTYCARLEDGDVFRSLGIVNLLEGDFFSWYADPTQWSDAVASEVRQVIELLAVYEDAANLFASGKALDLFRGLYEAVVPRVVRSSFGEFYTPAWLAEHVTQSADLRANWTLLDPCCGSGTFLSVAIAQLRRELKGQSPGVVLGEILRRVAGIDLNPLAVLTARVEYFIQIADLLTPEVEDLTIPVYLGDATSVPDSLTIDGVDCLHYQLQTMQEPVDAILPVALVRNTPRFFSLMRLYEQAIQRRDSAGASAVLLESLPAYARRPAIIERLNALSSQLVSLEERGWNGIWARILCNYLTTACLGPFSAIVGNPPWIDWKNLPEGYRNRIKELCIDRGLFSGAGRTGGINLNICALISYVAMSNWLGRGGRLAFLMPKELANQASYEGWRRLGNEKHFSFTEFHDWSSAGHPFDPVREDFMTFVVSRMKSVRRTLPTFRYAKVDKAPANGWRSASEALAHLSVSRAVAGQITPNSTAFTFAASRKDLDRVALVAGDCEYIGREGIEFYPQELLLWRYDSPGPRPGLAFLTNIQNAKSKYRIPRRRIPLETKYLHPLVKGPGIKPFSYTDDGLIVAFPYDESDPRRPVPAKALAKSSPLLSGFYQSERETLEAQTKFSDKIRGDDPGDFYGLARVGAYSFANTYVAFRDNTRWCAAVVTEATMPWQERKRFVFQNHAVSVCERRDGTFIDLEEAHYICAILNSPTVEEFIYASSDERSYKIRPPIYLPRFNALDSRHVALAAASKKAHASPQDSELVRTNIDHIYLAMCRDRAASQ